MKNPSKEMGLYPFYSLTEAFKEASALLAPVEATWGSATLDGLTGGIHRGDLAVVAGFSGAGKTMFCMHAALGAARAGKVVLYVSLNSDLSSIGLRVIGALTNWDLRGIREGKLTGRQLEQDLQGIPVPPELPLYFYDEAFTGWGGILKTCGRLQESKGLDLVIIDGLRPLLRNGGGDTDEKRAMQELLILLQYNARELNCQILAVLPMAEQGCESDTPMIEQTAEAIWYLGLPENAIDLLVVVAPQVGKELLSKPDWLQVAVLKNRYGPLCLYKIELDWKSFSLKSTEKPSWSPICSRKPE